MVHGRGRKSPQMADQPLSIYGSKLICNNLTGLAGEATWHAEWIPMRCRGHGRDDGGSKMGVQLVGGNDHAWSRLGISVTRVGSRSMKHHLGAGMSSLPAPLLFIEPRAGLRPQQTAVSSGGQRASRFRPAGSGSPGCGDHDGVTAHFEIDLFGETGLLDDGLRQPHATRIADAHNLCLQA